MIQTSWMIYSFKNDRKMIVLVQVNSKLGPKTITYISFLYAFNFTRYFPIYH